MKIKNLFIVSLTMLVSALFADAGTVDRRGNSRPSEPKTGKSIMEHYRGSNAERSLDAQKRAYAPSARKNEKTFGNGTTTPTNDRNRRSIGWGDIFNIIIEEKGGYNVAPTTTPIPPKVTLPKKKKTILL